MLYTLNTVPCFLNFVFPISHNNCRTFGFCFRRVSILLFSSYYTSLSYAVFEARPSASDSASGCRKGVGEFFGVSLYRFLWLSLREAHNFSLMLHLDNKRRQTTSVNAYICMCKLWGNQYRRQTISVITYIKMCKQ